MCYIIFVKVIFALQKEGKIMTREQRYATAKFELKKLLDDKGWLYVNDLFITVTDTSISKHDFDYNRDSAIEKAMERAHLGSLKEMIEKVSYEKANEEATYPLTKTELEKLLSPQDVEKVIDFAKTNRIENTIMKRVPVK